MRLNYEQQTSGSSQTLFPTAGYHIEVVIFEVVIEELGQNQSPIRQSRLITSVPKSVLVTTTPGYDHLYG